MAKRLTVWNAVLIRVQLKSKKVGWFLGMGNKELHGKVNTVTLHSKGLELHITGGKKPGKLVWQLPFNVAAMCV